MKTNSRIFQYPYLHLFLALTVFLFVASCATEDGRGFNPFTRLNTSKAATFASGTPGKVFVVVLENTSYESITSTAMPYLYRLSRDNSYKTNQYGNTHPSIGNYFSLTTGVKITDNSSFSGVVSNDNVVRRMLTAGKTWKSYAEDLPRKGYTGGNQSNYVRRHNPFTYFSDVIGTSQTNNLLPFTQFAIDLANQQLPDYTFIVPNQTNNAHDANLAGVPPLLNADKWLSNKIDPLIKSAYFNDNNGLLIICFDEGVTADTKNGGGHIFWTAVGPSIKKSFIGGPGTTQHPSTLRMMLEHIGIMNSFPGAANTAADLGEFYVTSSTYLPRTVVATDDAFVRGSSNYANINYGSSKSLDVKLTTSATYCRNAYLKFDLTGLSAVSNVILNLYGGITGTNTAMETYTNSVFGIPNSPAWSETTITWNNAPTGFSSSLATQEIGRSSGTIWRTYDVTSFIQSELASGRTSITLVIKQDGLAADGTLQYHAKENTSGNKPKLTFYGF